jgi:phosphoribosyl 1,2-cyclic phosphodiesterase
MEIRFWGVRGSVASPGPETARVGGNTSCVSVQCGATTLILDAGTGLRGLGSSLLAQAAKRGGGPLEATLLLSHVHWDHIQGLPFFTPLYIPGTRLTVAGTASGRSRSLMATLETQMSAPHFPVRIADVGATLGTKNIVPGAATRIGEATVIAAELDHPGGVTAYRIEHAGRVLVYATDVEHGATLDSRLVNLARGADALIYDAQYTPEEYPHKRGWGHSTYAVGAEVAAAAGVGELLLFHHDPTRTDDEVEAIEERARDLFAPTRAAREGLALDLPEVADLAPDSRAA